MHDPDDTARWAYAKNHVVEITTTPPLGVRAPLFL
jgi:hypothetical protein